MKLLLSLGLCLVVLSTGICQDTGALRKWEDNKYSMFIHFGMYSELGGVWRGQKVSYGYSEQILSHAQIFSDEYAKTADSFNPVRWNADSIASLAKKAGMRSIVITSKHHDGFCMFKTVTTDYNIVDATPFKRDVLKELSDACKRHGLNFGFYYSVIDWHYPQAYPVSSHNADFITPEHHEFSKKQLKELLTNYGPISELWFDMGSQTFQQSSELRALVKQLQPDCFIGNRIGNDQGDFSVMGDNEYPEYPIATPWQVPASMFDDTWGYRSWQKQVPEDEKVREKLLSLVKTVTHGGNYLLNIGPKGDGSVVEFERNVLLRMGKWLNENGDAIYGTRPLDVERLPYGALTAKGNKVYLHIYEQPADNTVTINGLLSKVKKAYALNDPANTLQFKQNGSVLSLALTPKFLDKEIVRIVVFEIEGEPVTNERNVIELRPGLLLSRANATPQYSFSGIDYYSSYRSTVKYAWNIHSSSKKSIAPVITYTEEEKGREFVLKVNEKEIPFSLTGGKQVLLPKQHIKWGDVHISGDRKQDGTKSDNWTNSDLYEKKTEIFDSWYWRQEINTAAATNVIVQIPTNDRVSIYLNDKEIFTVNNALRDTGRMTTILLPLKAGSNKLLVEYFNRFGKQVRLGVLNNSPQAIYEMPLPNIQFEKGRSHKVMLQLPSTHPIHENVDAPNAEIRFR